MSSEDITALKLFSFAFFTSVAITSSASTPAISINGNPIALTISFNGFSCSLKSSGIGGLFALYSLYTSFLNVLPLASNTTMIGDPSLSFLRVISILVTPLIAPVGCPEDDVSGGIAW